MSKSAPTLRDLFVPTKSSGQIPKLEQVFSKNVKGIKWDVVEDVLEDKVLDMLDLPVLGVLLSAWKKHREVKQAADSRGTAAKRVSLAQHTVRSEHHPYLETRVKGVPVSRLNFTIVVELILEGFILTIRDGKITTVQTGQARGQGSLALETSVILEKEFGVVQFPGTIQLGEGVPVE